MEETKEKLIEELCKRYYPDYYGWGYSEDGKIVIEYFSSPETIDVRIYDDLHMLCEDLEYFMGTDYGKQRYEFFDWWKVQRLRCYC